MMGQREILVFIAKKLDEYKIPYLLTGSFAVSYYGYPRATHDIDFIVEIYPGNYDSLINLMEEFNKEFVVDKNKVDEAIKQKSMLDIFDPESGVKIDFWFVKNDFDKSKFKRKVQIEINDQSIKLISAEDLILNKLLWCKKVRSERHLRDCAGIWRIQEDTLDKKYLDEWVKKLKLEDLLDEIKVMEY